MLRKLSLVCFGWVLLTVFTVTPSFASRRHIRAANFGCKNVITLKSVSPSARGGSLIWKSNWSRRLNREQTFAEGNHSQKGAAFLVFHKSSFVPKTSTLSVLDLNGKQIASMGRSPRCSYVIVQGKRVFACGEHERWYVKTGSGHTVPSLASVAKKSAGSSSVLIPLSGNTCAKVNDVYSNREQF